MIRVLFPASREVFPTHHIWMGAVGLILLAPAMVLVSTGILELNRPDALVHPALVLGGLAIAFAANAHCVFRVKLGRENGNLVGTLLLRFRGNTINLVALGLAGLLLGTIATYLVGENLALH